VQHGSRSRNLQTQGYPERFFDTSKIEAAIGIRAAKIVTLKRPFPSATDFDPDLRPAQINFNNEEIIEEVNMSAFNTVKISKTNNKAN